MSDPIGKLPPIRLTDGEADPTTDIRRRAIERQTRNVPEADTTDSQAEAPGSSGRRIYPSDRERRQRTITITLPDQDMMDYLKAEADRLVEEGNDEMTPTRLATLILVAGIDQWKEGKLGLTKEAAAVETIVVRPVQETEKRPRDK